MDKKPSIYIYSPSGAVRDKLAFRRGIRLLEKNGCDVEVDASALSSHQRFAGDDQVRIESIMRAATSGADIALITRGGYGLTRILDQLPYSALANAIEQEGVVVKESSNRQAGGNQLQITYCTLRGGTQLGGGF